MVLVLEDEHLESLQCSRCRKYLSVFPVKNHPNREVTCGRCSGIGADKDVSERSALYELIAEKYLFKCVNRYEGCRKLLRADETQAHETECLGNRFNCPKCDDSNGMTVLELIWHYKLRHASSYLQKNSFVIKPSSYDVMLYVQEDFVFFISMRYESNALYLCAMTLTDVKATQVFSIKRGPLWEKSIKKPCTIISAFNCNSQIFNLDSVESIEVIFNLEVLKGSKLYDISIPSTSKSATGESVEYVDQIETKEGSTVNVLKEKAFKIKLTKELEHNLGYKLTDCGTALLSSVGHRIDLTCSNCKQVIRPLVFKCKNLKHNICNFCRAWCGICDSSVVESDSDDLLSKIIRRLSFPCRKKCGEYFNTNLLLTHENSCQFKFLKCPVCSFEMDSSDTELIDIHLLDNHQILNFIGEYNVERVKQFIGQKSNSELYFLYHDQCCYLKWSKNDYDYDYDSYSYDLNFGLFGYESNLKLDIICKGSKLSCNNVLPKVFLYNISSYVLYINFNCAK